MKNDLTVLVLKPSTDWSLATTSPNQELVNEMLSSMGEDIELEDLLNTPERSEKAMRELASGYHLSPETVVGEGIFSSEGPGLSTVKDIEFFSLCEHYPLSFWGKASIAYLPGEMIF